ncbi:U2 small nuclear ribonucleoprotein A'-like [Rhopilema esculentum]|uniref:U2 small nuclear ribonucleoprotein A'-like n=1 Tax=Rhopilema esculentum TaxID=499914 RepID=UPI0031CECDC7|eukprot:gene4899-21231_t
MVKITVDLIEQCAQYTNAVKEREIDLRGYKISVIENMGATLDQFDCIDFSDNDIRKVEGFPHLKRLKTILFNNNRISRVQENLEESLPNLETLVLTNNNIAELADLEPLATIKKLTYLSLMRNPVANKQSYRLFVIHKVPQLRVLDFVRVRQKEREAAKRLFSSKRGEQMKKDIAAKRPKTFEPKMPEPVKKNPEQEKDIAAIKDAIAKATSLEEVQRLEQMLKKGQVPGKQSNAEEENGIEETEEMDET